MSKKDMMDLLSRFNLEDLSNYCKYEIDRQNKAKLKTLLHEKPIELLEGLLSSIENIEGAFKCEKSQAIDSLNVAVAKDVGMTQSVPEISVTQSASKPRKKKTKVKGKGKVKRSPRGSKGLQ